MTLLPGPARYLPVAMAPGRVRAKASSQAVKNCPPIYTIFFSEFYFPFGSYYVLSPLGLTQLKL